MARDLSDIEAEALLSRVQELEARLAESEGTLDAIRRGEVDALVVGGTTDEQKIYTLETSDRPYRVLIEQIQEGAVTLSDRGVVFYCNRRLAEMLGVPQERIVGQSLLPFILDDDRSLFKRLLAEARQRVARQEFTLRTNSGTPIPVYMSLSPLQREGEETLLCGVLTELTDQKQHLSNLATANSRLMSEISERERIEEALRQSQKMEAVGQLTGGLAHDFNNLLAGISGSLELMQSRMQQGRLVDVDKYMTAAQGAAKRAAALTHRLLAFSRRQTLDPKPTNVNTLIMGMQEMIQRTVGPSISIEVVGSTGAWPALVDPSQLENALLNLCINARDAMPDGGRITVETANKWIDERSALQQDMPEGQYLSMSVTDTGTGMPPDVIARVFEPFFTTKPTGEGTGLGLSMIYGFAQQSGGQVRIYSEVGMGTTVSIYLPRHYGAIADQSETNDRQPVTRSDQGETVLVVDDEPTVRMLIADVLDDLGYTAIEANDSAAGLKVLQSSVRIDLLITDVGLPGGMNGRQMADAARIHRPDLKVLFITGYAENAIIGNGRLVPGMAILTKPFSIETMAARIRSMIEASKALKGSPPV